MKKLLVFILFFIFCHFGLAQTNATGVYSMYGTRSIGLSCFGVSYNSFTMPTLPNDAVITAIYPVAWIDFNPVQGVYALGSYGSGATDTSCGSGGSNIGMYQINTATSSSEFHGTSIGTSLSALSGQRMFTGLWSTLNTWGADNLVNLGHTKGVGFAIYYTSANPHIDQLIPPPVSVSTGTGVAWSVPTALDQTGNIPTCGGIFGNACGYAYGTLGRATPYGYVSLGGIINIPDAVHFNGTMTVSFQKLNVKNICNSPYLNVPNLNIQYKVVDGVPVGLSNGRYISQDCLSIRVPYYVQLFDTNHKLVSADNWYVPNVATGMVDIGNMQESKFNGPVQVAIPQAIISTPVGSQSITQPLGTSLDIYGTVNFHGTVGYTSTPAFNIIQASQVLVNGVTSSSYPLDVNGIINASTGFCVSGCSGLTDGMALLYSSAVHAFVPGTPSVTFPNIYYQTAKSGITSFPQRATFNFDNNVFSLSDSVNPSQTMITMPTVATGATYTNVSSITIDNFGRVHAVNSGATYPAGTIAIAGTSLGHDASIVYSTSYPTSVPITAVIPCSPQAGMGLDISYVCWAVGTTVYTQLTNNSYNATRTIAANTMNFRVLQ